jgi:hypothetical protein
MPRIISPIRKRPINDSQNLTQTRAFNYKLFFTSIIALTILICLILFFGIEDTLRYLKYIVLLGSLYITLT